MRHLSSGVAARCLQEGPWRKFTQDELIFSYSAGIGTLLLMSAVEVARREATLGCKRQGDSEPSADGKLSHLLTI